ncbi:MAG: phage tail protein [Myxococcales bacterium]|nr:phage tail protein [Myxococcales bacterium]
MAEPFIGEIRLFGFDFPPRGWAFCEGQLLSIVQFQQLFSIIGTTYGGDGRVNFGLPDLRGRVPMHPDDDVRLGGRAGAETVTLLASQLPSHGHPVPASGAPAVAASPAGAAPAVTRRPQYAPTGEASPLPAPVVGTAGGNQPHDNMSPVIVMRFAIATAGLFPPRQ